MLAKNPLQRIDELIRARLIFGVRRRHGDENKSHDPSQDPNCELSQPHFALLKIFPIRLSKLP
jgi:hypothetical protein